jgi:hypothetical protein
MDGTNSNKWGYGVGAVSSGWFFEGVLHHPLCGCCAAQPNFAELHAHTSLLSKVGQRFLDFYIAAAEQ